MSVKLLLIVSVVLVGSLSSQTTSPFVGDWKWNTARSKPKTGEALLRISAIPGGFEFRQARRAGDLPPSGLPCVVDGKERTFAFRDAKHSSHTVSCQLINERTLEVTVNHDNGKLITTQIVTISTDGKTLVQKMEAPSTSMTFGQVFDRQ
jgi:hypothetical protein